MSSQPVPMPALPPRRWDIFCRVIDNFGDIGVCWRLARQLAGEYGQQVRLWIDEPATLAPLLGQVQSGTLPQAVDGVELCHWSDPLPATAAADVVIEAFACELPESYLQAMVARPQAPHWFNLEYLSAEPWVEDCHGVASPHPRLPLIKTFFFPGFSRRTGGLLRERRLTLPPTPAPRDLGQPLTISLFCYDDAPLGELLPALAAGPVPIRLLVPPGKPRQALHRHLGSDGPAELGLLRIEPIAFRSQDDYDTLLRQCDLNFVRGEDSFIRAQWAGRPFVWQIYRQDDDAHLDKLDAFLDRYLAGAGNELATSTAGFFRAWNTGQSVGQCWPAFLAAWPALTQHTWQWTAKLFQLPDLAANLLSAAEKPV